jgi:hypothetical protein
MVTIPANSLQSDLAGDDSLCCFGLSKSNRNTQKPPQTPVNPDMERVESVRALRLIIYQSGRHLEDFSSRLLSEVFQKKFRPL